MSYRHGRLVKGRANEVIEGPVKEPAGGAWRDDWAPHVNLVVLRFEPAETDADEVAPEVTGLIEPLTNRELEVLHLVAVGRRNQDIAQGLVVSLETVKKYVSHILGKLGASSRTQAVAHAHALGLIAGGQISSFTGGPVSVQRVLLGYYLGGVSAPGSTHNVPHATAGHDAAMRST
jgi:DNA-binding CsgD family transcriptional regulator